MKFADLETHIDQSVSEILQQVPKKKQHLAEIVLQSTRRAILAVLHTFPERSLTVKNINDICFELDNSKLVHADSVLQNIGIPDLKAKILENRQAIKWNLLLSELRSILEEGQPFSPATISSRNRDLYKAIKAALVQENGEECEFDWELLRARLPDDLQTLFEAETVTKEAKREAVVEHTKDIIDENNLHDAIAVLGRDPKKLEIFLDLGGFNNSEKTNSHIVQIAFGGIATPGTDMEELVKQCKESLDPIEIIERPPRSTEEKSARITVYIPEGTRRLLVFGPWNRNKKINGEREVELKIPLKIGQQNTISIVALDGTLTPNTVENVKKSPRKQFSIRQTSEDDTDTMTEFLQLLSQQVLANLRSDPERKRLFVRCLEESIIKQFVNSFYEGVDYIKDLKAQQKGKGFRIVVQCLNEVLATFERVQRQQYPFIKERDTSGKPIELAFFQKYCIYKASKMMADGNRAIILANEPGLGKTVTALAIAHDMEPIVICPNQAASTWVEEQAKFFSSPFLTNIAGAGTARGTDMIERRSVPGVIANVEFIRHKEGSRTTNRKFNALNRRHHPERERITIIDEAHFLKNTSHQSAGYSQLTGDYDLLLTASPWRSPDAVREVMAKVLPGDERFKNPTAFRNAFPPSNPESMKSLFVMMNQYVIRFLKQDVMPTFDPEVPLDEQEGLPEKEYIDPIVTGIGHYQLTPEQEGAIWEMFEDWEQWAEEYDEYMPKGKTAQADGLRRSNDQLSKIHALRYMMNHPRYVGSEDPSPKHEAVMDILDQELANGNKGIIFCRYQNQVEDYAELLEERGIEFVTYYGEVVKGEGTDSKGYKVNERGKQIKYSVDEYGSFILQEGRPVIGGRGQNSAPMLALDYERLIFQNDENVKIALCTYAAGSTSVTFTAADFMIKDGIPTDAIEEYQAEDRIHRMDREHKKYNVRYYTMVAHYSPEFLEGTDEMVVDEGSGETAYEKWFEQGTYHEVQIQRLAAQRVSFEILNNGIAQDPELFDEDGGVQFNFS